MTFLVFNWYSLTVFGSHKVPGSPNAFLHLIPDLGPNLSAGLEVQMSHKRCAQEVVGLEKPVFQVNVQPMHEVRRPVERVGGTKVLTAEIYLHSSRQHVPVVKKMLTMPTYHLSTEHILY
jgi:hypothetical protein